MEVMRQNRCKNYIVSLACNIYKCHETLRRCSFDDIIKMEDELNGIKVVGKIDRCRLECTQDE